MRRIVCAITSYTPLPVNLSLLAFYNTRNNGADLTVKSNQTGLCRQVSLIIYRNYRFRIKLQYQYVTSPQRAHLRVGH